jgi:hypothetical protein
VHAIRKREIEGEVCCLEVGWNLKKSYESEDNLFPGGSVGGNSVSVESRKSLEHPVLTITIDWAWLRLSLANIDFVLLFLPPSFHTFPNYKKVSHYHRLDNDSKTNFHLNKIWVSIIIVNGNIRVAIHVNI